MSLSRSEQRAVDAARTHLAEALVREGVQDTFKDGWEGAGAFMVEALEEGGVEAVVMDAEVADYDDAYTIRNMTVADVREALRIGRPPRASNPESVPGLTRRLRF